MCCFIIIVHIYIYVLIEIKELKLLMKDLSVFTYNGIEKDGSRAIIDQIICSHARFTITLPLS